VISLVPADTPVTNPELSTVATLDEADTQARGVAGVPDPVNCVVDPAQIVNVPEIVGIAWIVAVTAVLAAVVHPFAVAST
jgi:hypothetical protein